VTLAAVGNDVVDLRDPDAARDGLHPRFDARAFDRIERAWIGAGVDPHRRRWSLWAAKEAAHKALRQERPALGFAPGHYHVALGADGRGTVRRDGDPIDVTVVSGAAWVHAVAFRGTSRGIRAAVASLEDLTEPDAGHAARRLLLDSLPGRAVRLGRRERIPRLRVGGRPVAVSLSHHGRFVAFARRSPGAPERPA